MRQRRWAGRIALGATILLVGGQIWLASRSHAALAVTMAIGLVVAFVVWSRSTATTTSTRIADLAAALDAELHRSRRHERPFVVARIDVAHQPAIADDQLACRSIDQLFHEHDGTYLLMPEIDRAGAQGWLDRLSRSHLGIAGNTTFAVFPEDGYTVDRLLAVARRQEFAPLRGVPPIKRAQRTSPTVRLVDAEGA